MGDNWGDEAFDEAAYPAGRWRLPYRPAVLAAIVAVLFAAGFGAYLVSSGGMDGEEGTGAGDSTEQSAATSEQAQPDSTGAGSGTVTAGEGSLLVDAPDGAFVSATLDLGAGPVPGMFTLSGRVPDAETAQALTEAAEVSYAPFVLSGIEVDTSLGPAPWLATSPQLIGLLPSITDGTILVTEDRIRLSGRSPNQEYVDLLSGALDQLGGLPVEADVEITDLVAPRFVASVDDGSIDLSGEVPSEAIIELLTAGAAAAYGPSNVTSELTVDGSTYTSFWMFTMPGVFQLFAPFPAYEIQVDDGITTGALHGGILFAFDSSEVTEETAQILNVGVAVMARDRSIHMTVEGHTDSDGASDYNDELSMDRATSVIGYFIQAGISEDRLLATGVGEDDPIASNDTEQGRASNRRVEFLFGPSFDLGSPG